MDIGGAALKRVDEILSKPLDFDRRSRWLEPQLFSAAIVGQGSRLQGVRNTREVIVNTGLKLSSVIVYVVRP